MELLTIKTDYIAKKQRLAEALDKLVEHAVNFDEELEINGNKSDIDPNELEWDNTKDERNFEILMHMSRITEQIIANIDEVLGVGEDNKKKHRLKKSLETLISSIRKIKKESKEYIENEQQLQNTADEALKRLDDIRL